LQQVQRLQPRQYRSITLAYCLPDPALAVQDPQCSPRVHLRDPEDPGCLNVICPHNGAVARRCCTASVSNRLLAPSYFLRGAAFFCGVPLQRLVRARSFRQRKHGKLIAAFPGIRFAPSGLRLLKFNDTYNTICNISNVGKRK
jgi:hypothetical protein